ncbi:DeoC and LMWPc domain containing protein [Trichuris trichiura]|uniref:2-deoxy-D-ribose 5-phosphate aldolase n=1 Tax=Trichuris trichiura TaxID=36087 RepID=A0A077ZCG9_TRITR|nr:DeoC and LMWPc domain containing protein [Trichuris trichiura]
MVSCFKPLDFSQRVVEPGIFDEEDIQEARSYMDGRLQGLTELERRQLALQIVRCLDLTSLRAVDTPSDIEDLVDLATHPFRSIFPSSGDRLISCSAVCVYPSLVADAVRHRNEKYPNSDLRVATVAGGFPSGQYFLQTKTLEVQLAVEDGADEVDVVINRALAAKGKWDVIHDELTRMKLKCPPHVRMKTILSVGDLNSSADVYRASMVAMLAGSDFIKTSTGKEEANATFYHSYPMCLAIRNFFDRFQRRVGFKAAGGIRCLDDALIHYLVVEHMLGDEWTKPDLFRIGASSLLKDIVDSFADVPRGFNIGEFLDDHWEVDSAATCDYHVGGSPDHRTMKVLQKHGITDYKHVVRMIVEDDFKNFNYILGMDDSNVSYLTEFAQQLPKSKAVIQLLGSYDESNKEKIIPDPYYTRGLDSFENVYELCLKACDGLLRHAEPMEKPLMYVIVRSDLISKFSWPMGAVIAQACHATSAVLWKFRDDQIVQKYMEDEKSLAKVDDEASLLTLSQRLSEANVEHVLWVEMPENLPTAIALKPNYKSQVRNFFKSMILFK